MDYNKWLCKNEQNVSAYSEKIDKLINAYIQVFHRFFDLPLTKDKQIFFKMAKEKCIQESDFLFLIWLESQGIAKLEELIKLNIPYKESVDSKFNLVLGSIEEELNWSEQSKKSMRSIVINTLNNLTPNLKKLE